MYQRGGKQPRRRGGENIGEKQRRHQRKLNGEEDWRKWRNE
jgi:hypothetical protein